MKKIILVVAVVMIAVMLTALFVGCSAESYEKQLKNKGYEVTTVKNEGLGKVTINAFVATLKAGGIDLKGSIEYMVTGANDDTMVVIVKFEKSADANAYRKQAKSEAKDAEELGLKIKVAGTGKVVKVTTTGKK